jgi:hypothetical protein
VTLKVTVWDCELVVSTTVLSLTVKLEIDGACVSVLFTVTDTVSVAWFPAASVTVKVRVSEVDPKE